MKRREFIQAVVVAGVTPASVLSPGEPQRLAYRFPAGFIDKELSEDFGWVPDPLSGDYFAAHNAVSFRVDIIDTVYYSTRSYSVGTDLQPVPDGVMVFEPQRVRTERHA